jgi:hypothetical protein
VVLVTEAMDLEQTLSALDRQVYKPEAVLVVGPVDHAGPLVASRGYTTLASVKEVLSHLPEAADFVWWIHGDTRPRPDALHALVHESLRHDASVAGSKVLETGAADRLVSVGSATDAFGEPYSGLDPGELDLEQYDVVREVAFVSPLSMLIRRDLLRGLGGLDGSLPSQAAGLDLSQRARLAGGKVVVVPSSEVFHAGSCPADAPGWRQLAGRHRAMLIAYRPVTLAWVVPVGFLAGLADGFGQLLLGRLRPLLGYPLSWIWNLGRLPSTIAARRAVNRIRQAGDEELFRFQVAGSVRLRETAAELGERLSRALESGEGESISERARVVWKRPSALLAIAALVALLVGTRTVWLTGLPQSGFSLLPGDDPLPTLLAYSGGWNPSELGTPNPPPPVAALGATATLILGGHPGLAATLLTLASLIAGLLGIVRLTKRMGAGLGAGYAGAAAYLGGAAAAALFGAGQWPLLAAAGPLPWALDAILSPWPQRGRERVGLIARGSLAAALTAAAYPPALAVVTIGGTLLALTGARRGGALLRVLAITVLGAVGIAPWLVGGEVMALLEAAPVPLIRPAWLWPATVGLAVAVAAANRPKLAAVAFGGAAAAGGWLLGMVPVLPPGIGLAGLLAASLGAGVLASLLAGSGANRWGRGLAVIATAVLVAPALLMVGRGRAGLPPDQWSRSLDFAGAITDGGEVGRVLLFGLPGELPGGSRSVGSIAYRLINGSRPSLDQAYLPGPRRGDHALEQAVAEVAAASSLRPGAVLGEFGISWLVTLPSVDRLDEALARQVDLSPLHVDPELLAFENLAPSPRAVTDRGEPWAWTGSGYRGPAGPDRVRLADNADQGWGPDWSRLDWANSVAAAQGSASFRANPFLRGSALASVGMLVIAAGLGWWGRRRREEAKG